MEHKDIQNKIFNYDLFMETEDYISLNNFSKEDQQKIIEFNCCGNIIFHVTTKFKTFDEIWLFNNQYNINNYSDDLLIPIWPYKISSTENLELIPEGDLEDIQISFEPYTKEMIDEQIVINKYNLDNKLDVLSFTDEVSFSSFDNKSKVLFKRYGGKGLIIRTVFSRLGRKFQEIWEFESVEREILLSEVNDDTILQIKSESLSNELNLEFYPEQDFLRVEYSFKPFSDEEYNLLKKTVEIFDYNKYLNKHEFIECVEFTYEDNQLIEKYKSEGLVYYEFKTINDEIIRDYYEIVKLTKHNFDKELYLISQEMDLSHFSEEIGEMKYDLDFYDLEVVPYNFGERNFLTINDFEIFGKGNWYYKKDKFID